MAGAILNHDFLGHALITPARQNNIAVTCRPGLSNVIASDVNIMPMHTYMLHTELALLERTMGGIF